VIKRRLLVQWIGHSDLRAMAGTLNRRKREALLKEVGGEPLAAGNSGPTKTLVSTQSFDEIRLLSNYRSEWNKAFVGWLGGRAIIVPTDIEKPTDYVGIFRCADAELSKIRKSCDWPITELCLHLSPGTPAMTAVWLLLGKTRYPATFYETFGGASWETEIPFDLTVDVLPEILRDPDTYLQHLSAERPRDIEGFEDIVGESQAIRIAVGRAKRVAMRGASVLLLGESGTGKELFARAIHAASSRRDKPFQAINCAALTETLLEAELFGHAKGAFTGASQDRAGAFEAANGGTLFLDEVGECDPQTQAKLLRVLEPVKGAMSTIRQVRRIGENKEREVDVRVIAATNRNLVNAIDEGRFRSDLYYRLAVATIKLPPLRDRRSDVLEIADAILRQLNGQFHMDEPNYKHKSLSGGAKIFVKRHDWPGNVRQLRNVLTQAAVFADSESLSRGDIEAALAEMPALSGAATNVLDRPLGDGFSVDDLLVMVHKHYLKRAMHEAKGVKVKAARLLGIRNYQTLAHRLEQHQIDDDWEATE
jgi:DNA-binding NtrC family response regulator